MEFVPRTPPAPPAPTPEGWRPPAESSRRSHTIKMVVAVVVALAVSAFVLASFAKVASKRPEKIDLGSRTFVMKQLQKHIEKSADGPLFFNDLVKDERPLPLAIIYVGKDNWAALRALAPGAPEKCVVQWDSGRSVFLDPCTKQVYAPDGTRDDGGPALERFGATADVEGDRLIVDLNVAYADTLNSRPPS